ncbi:MAG: hypothetical protein NWF03_00835 [Candidatus Bathyarchaeota archaeon]|nr:hypothetical protein [Candidatus Bathyarchaeota archaeon]
MAGATIDHMISLTILVAALLIAMMSFNQMFSSAVAYETNTQVATKAMDIMNTLCLSPGSPTDWGATNETVLGFGLQDPTVGGYALSPYSIMRLKTAQTDSQLVYYPGTDLYYNNVTSTSGYTALTPLGDCINYTTASELLGIDGSYGFNINIQPTLAVEVTPVSTKPLVLNVAVRGSGLPLSGAIVNYHLLEVDTKLGQFPYIIPISDETITGPSGSVNITFPDVMELEPTYTFTAYVNVGGVTGVGYYTHNTADGDLSYITPLIQDYDNGTILIAHSWDIFQDAGIQAEVKFNATFYILTSDFELQPVPLDASDHLNWGSNDYFVTYIPPSETGFLVISYLKSAVEMGSIMMPWGVGSLGVTTSFGSSVDSYGSDFVATEVRLVTIDGISYRVQVSTWKLGN